ncbi:2737_t:CDS:2 [Entrophospora sp. SA101]|nr:2737_t:CDS:2 [Entrophospora sp. SA101]
MKTIGNYTITGLDVREDLGSMQKQSTSPHLLHSEFGTHMEKLSRSHNNNKKQDERSDYQESNQLGPLSFLPRKPEA